MLRLGLIFYALSAISAIAALSVMLFGSEWIEVFTGFEPDGGNGSLEFLLIVAPMVMAVGFGTLGHHLRQRAHA